MRKCYKIEIENPEEFRKQLIVFAQTFPVSCILNSNEYYTNKSTFNYHSYNFLAALGTLDELNINNNKESFISLFEFWNKQHDWIFGHFNYDLKNSIENLKSVHPDFIGFPDMFFFRPQFVVEIKNKTVLVWHTDIDNNNSVTMLLEKIKNIKVINKSFKSVSITSRFNKEKYINSVNHIKRHIQSGDIYEMNFCQEFFSENVEINPATLYIKLCDISPAPFSCFYKVGDKFLCSASPERFLKKNGSKIISQPIKGTSKKGNNSEENNILKNNLSVDQKERSENIMIVDLVRNDLSRTAKQESVKVEELCGIYEFPQVFQMISTISSELSDKYNFTDAIKCAFPMGSMTGAPKIRAMQIIEKFEQTKRGLYSGSVGYISPNRDFDFNVVIRSIQYNKFKKYLSFLTGGAITIKSNPENEYEECLLKAEGLLKALNGIFV